MEKQPINVAAPWVEKLLQYSEHEMLEFKRVKNVSNVVKTASAMANGEGGVIVLGLGDQKQGTGEERLFGIEENPEALGEIKRDFSSQISPPLAYPETDAPSYNEIKIQKSNGFVITLVLVQIAKSNTVHSYNNATYIRSGSQNRQINAQEIHRLCLKRGVESVVDQPTEVPVELLNTVWWEQYAGQRQLTRPLEEALRHIGLSKKDNDVWKPTVAAILLFAEEPNGLLDRKCSIRIFHYHGHKIEYGPDTNLVRPPITISGPILKQIRDAVDAVSRELESGVQRTTQGFELKQKYPQKVVQEAITNAVLHRDYQASADIQIRIFTNRIEVESPGLFPGAITPENIGEIGSKPRNPKLTDHIREFPNPPNLDAGEGVRMMKMTMDSMGLYPPVFEEHQNSNKETIVVRISNEAKLSEWELVRDYLSTHDSISNKELRDMLNLSKSDSHKASRLLKGWVESGLLQVINPAAGTRSRKYGMIRPKTLLANILASNLEKHLSALYTNDLWKQLLADEVKKGGSK